MILSFFKKLPLFEMAALIIALLALAGMQPIHNAMLMGIPTAITFIVCIASKLLFKYADTNRKLLLPARILALCTSLAGIIAIAVTVFQFNSNLFFIEKINKPDIFMVLITAFSFILIGIALYCITLNNAEKIFIPHTLSVIILFIALLSAIAYFFNENTFNVIPFYKPMDIATATNFLLISFSILLVNKRKGFMGHLTSEYSGGKIARWLIPAAIAIPVLFGFFQLETVKTGFYTHPYNVALITMARIIILIFFIAGTAVIINRSNKTTIAEIEERKKNEEILRYRTAVLEAQNEAIPDAILIVDIAGKIVSFNHHFAELWNFPQNIIDEKDDATALKFAMTQLVDPDNFINRVNYIYTHSVKNTKDEILFKDGRIIERYGNAVVGDGGTTYGWAWYFKDITFSKNYENKIKNFNKELEIKINERTEELRKSEKRFRSLIENAHDIISLSDENGKRFYISPAIEKITGYTVQEMLNQPVFNILHPDDIKNIEHKEFINRPGMLRRVSFRFMHKNGSSVWMEGTIANLLHDENVKAIVGNYHDVTERKIAEEKIRVSNERFEIVSKATNDAIWDWNLETDEIEWNEEVNSMFGYSVENIATGIKWKTHIHPDDFKRVTRKIVYHIKNGIQNWQDEYRFLCANSIYKDIFDRGFILFDKNNKPYRMIGAMQDITQINKLQLSLNNERIKKQKELTSATIQGQEKERTEIGRELHDNINQLLTATKLYLDVAAKQPLMKDEMIVRSAENLSVCMEEIRKLSSSLVPPSMGANSFSEVIQNLIEPIKLATAINIEYNVEGVNKNLLTNDQQLNLYRIIQEHLNNILKHSKANNAFIKIASVNDQIELNIKDDGQGFNIALRRKGIGFKNIQSRAELLQGKMDVVSKPGQGCLLVVNFPII